MTRAEAIQHSIAHMEEARRIHAWWVKELRADPEWATESVPRIQVAGDVGHHEKWIKHYDKVLGVLRGKEDLEGKP